MGGHRTDGTTATTKPEALRARRAEPANVGGPALAARPGVVRVLCVDDHVVLVEGLKARFAIEEGIEVVGHLTTAERLTEETGRLLPDVVLLDIEMPGPDAFEMSDRMRRKYPDVQVIVLSAHIRDAFISASFRAGISGYFAKSDELSDIVRGVRDVARTKESEFILGPKVRERCRPLPAAEDGARGRVDATTDVMRAGSPRTLLESLTPREQEILRYIGKGMSRGKIATQLCRSVKTVDAHQGRMMKKLGLADRADLMRFAIREGLAQA